MADYTMFHALGQGEQLDPNDPRRTTQPAPPAFQPQGPYQPQQQLQPQQLQPGVVPGYGIPNSPGFPPQAQSQPPHQYGAASPYIGTPSPAGQGYGAPPPPPPQGPLAAGPVDGNGLAAQMAGMGLGGAPGGDGSAQHSVRRKKKDRHAFHTVEAPSSSFSASPLLPGAGGAPNSGFAPAAPGFASAGDASGGMNQFPAAVNAPFNPLNPADPASFAARSTSGSGVPGAPGQQLGQPGQPTGGAPMSEPAVVSASGQQKVSLDDIPSVPLSRDSVQEYFFNNVYPTFQRHVPPPAAISFVAQDEGNASPKFARLTLNNIPATQEGLTGTGLPLGLLVQPLAPQQAGEAPVPVLDFGDAGPPRCRRCRAYINPFMVFRSGGNKFVCNLCTYPNDTPSEYFCATTPYGARLDRLERPELCRGTVEFVVPKEYWTREPVGLRWLFVIDVTQESYNKGFLEAFCEGILAALYGSDGASGDEDEEDAKSGDDVKESGENGSEEGSKKKTARRSIPPNSRVGFVTYDKEVHFYNVSSALEQAQMMIMPDVEDPFVPLSDGLFVDPYESRSVITSLLTRLPQMFSTIKNPEPALLSTLNAAISALETTGGKVVCSLSALPTWGPGRLFMRDDGKHTGGEIDKKLFTTEHPAWRKAAERMAGAGIGVDFFLAAPTGGYLDIATVGHVSSTTGGEVFYYPNFVAGRDNAKLSMEVRHVVTRETGYQALMKVRCSNGLQVSAYHGNFIQHTFGADLEIGCVDADKAVAATFTYDGKLDAKLDVHFQAALLYTTANGERRVRCSNVIAAASDGGREAMKFVDQDAVVAVLAKEAASRLANTSATLKEVRQWITERTIDVLAAYRKNYASQAHPPSQLIMPERLKEYCMFMLGLVKSRAFKGGSEPTDRRVHDMRMLRSMGARELSLYLYPRIVPLHNLQPEEGFPDAANGGQHLRLPPAMRATFARVEPGGVYLVDNGQQCLIWFEKQTSPNLLADLFGGDADTQTLQGLDPYTAQLPVLPTHLSAQVRNIVAFLQTLRGSKGLTIQLARQGIDGAEFEFARMLVEDRNNEAQSYVDWLVHIHKGVQMELGGQRKRDDYGDGSAALSTFAGLRPAYW